MDAELDAVNQVMRGVVPGWLRVAEFHAHATALAGIPPILTLADCWTVGSKMISAWAEVRAWARRTEGVPNLDALRKFDDLLRPAMREKQDVYDQRMVDACAWACARQIVEDISARCGCAPAVD